MSRGAESELTERGRRGLGLVACLVLALGGAWLSGSLLGMHFSGGSSGGGFLAGVCGGTEGESSGCDKVMQSRWSVMPPRSADATGAESGQAGGGGIPTAALGLFYFSAVAVWLAVVGMPRSLRRWPDRAVPLVVGIGCAGSLGFIIIMKAAIGAWCPLCLASHMMNFLLLGALLFFRPRGEAEDVVTGSKSTVKRGRKGQVKVGKENFPGTVALPARRITWLALVLVVAVCFAEWNYFRANGLEAANAELRALANDSSKIELAYFEIEREDDLAIRPDDPLIEREGAGSYAEIVYWSDVECPYCASFDYLLFEEILPMFKGNLRVVYKHYPIKSHKNAFVAATALEAARLQGKFWPMKELLMEKRRELAAVDYAALAGELGMDAARFAEDMASDTVAERIREDQRQLNEEVGSSKIPTVFLNKRRLTNQMRSIPAFWQTRAEAVKRTRLSAGLAWNEDYVFDKTALKTAPLVPETPVAESAPAKTEPKGTPEAKPAKTPKVATKPAPERVLTGNLAPRFAGTLVSRDEESGALAPFDMGAVEAPEYYLIYQSAHWCPPCRTMTPLLVDFYNETKKSHPQFEMVLLSSDRSEADMVSYVEWGKMPWPALVYEKRGAIPEIRQLASSSIPCLTLLDQAGNVIATSKEKAMRISEVVNELQKRLGSRIYSIVPPATEPAPLAAAPAASGSEEIAQISTPLKPISSHASQTPTPTPTPALEGKKSAPGRSPGVAPRSAPPAGKPAMRFDEMEHDFGKALEGAQIRHDFVFANAGDGVLAIQGVRPDTGVRIEEEYTPTLKPGEMGVIPLTLDTARMKGRVEAKVVLSSNAPEQRQMTLKLKGEVAEFLDVVPKAAAFGFIEDLEKPQERTLMITNLRDDPVAILGAESSSAAFAAEVVPVEAGKRYQLRVRTVPPLENDANRGTITLKTADGFPDVPVIVMALPPKPIRVAPERIVLAGDAESSPERTVTVRLTSAHGDVFAVTKAESELADVEVRIEALEAGKDYRVEIDFPAGFQLPEGKTYVPLTLRTDHRLLPTIQVPVLQGR